MIELTHNWDQDALRDRQRLRPSRSASRHLRYLRGAGAGGAQIPRQPGPMKHGTPHIAFIEDPGRLQGRADRPRHQGLRRFRRDRIGLAPMRSRPVRACLGGRGLT